MKEISLPIAKYGRKYGYITWRKKDDQSLRVFFGEKEEIELYVGDQNSSRKRIDWKRRRIWITYTFTRNLSPNVTAYQLSKASRGEYRLLFR